MRRRAVVGAADVSHFNGAVFDAVRPAVHGGGIGGGNEDVDGQSTLLGGFALSGTSSTSVNYADDDQQGHGHGKDDAENKAEISVVVV